jgi:PEGA domain
MMQGLASQMTRQILDAAHAQGMKVVPPEEVETFLGPKNSLALRQCGPSPACIAARLTDLPANRAVVGTLGRDQSHYLVHLWLISLSPPGLITEVDRAILIASRRLQTDVAAALPALLRGEEEAKGTLVLESSVPHADVTIDGEPAGQTPFTRLLKPGKHELRVSHADYYAVERLVTVEPNKVTRDTVRLVAVPGAEPLVLLPPPETPAPVVTGGGFRVSAGGWVVLGASLAAAGGGAFLAVAAHNNENELNAGFNPARNSYQGFRSQAVTGQRQATWANVCFGVAGAGLVTFGILTWISSTAPVSTQATLGVGVTPQGGALSLSGSF